MHLGPQDKVKGSNCNEIRAFIGMHMPYQELIKNAL